MKIIIDRSNLLRPLSHVQSVVERRNTIPILSNVVIKADENHLFLSATDMDIDILEKFECKVITPWFHNSYSTYIIRYCSKID